MKSVGTRAALASRMKSKLCRNAKNKRANQNMNNIENIAKTKRVAVITGGINSERDLSLKTAASVAEALESENHQVVTIHVGPHLAHDIHAAMVDCAFLTLPDAMTQEGEVQGLLEVLRVPYTGCGAHAVARSTDKDLVKKVLRQHNLATPSGYVISNNELMSLAEKHLDLGFPATVRSAHGSSVAALVNDFETLQAVVANVCASNCDALVERAIAGREVTVAVLNGKVLGPCEISRKGNTIRHHLPPRISSTRAANLEIMALRAYDSLHCSGIVRVDFLVPDVGNEVIVDVNVNPGMTSLSLVTKIAKAQGISYEELCECVVSAAQLDTEVVEMPVDVPELRAS
jgi:D-alanine-D-alanine ligase